MANPSLFLVIFRSFQTISIIKTADIDKTRTGTFSVPGIFCRTTIGKANSIEMTKMNKKSRGMSLCVAWRCLGSFLKRIFSFCESNYDNNESSSRMHFSFNHQQQAATAAAGYTKFDKNPFTVSSPLPFS